MRLNHVIWMFLDHISQGFEELERLMQFSLENYWGKFRTLAANARYYHSQSSAELDRLENLEIEVNVDGLTKEDLRIYLQKVLQRTRLQEYQYNCRMLLGEPEIHWFYPAPRLFVVLPTDLDSWSDSDPTTHSFRLYYLCNSRLHKGALEKIPQHVHLSYHPGYVLSRPQEFFQIYGDYTLRVLQMVQHGYSKTDYDIPSLDTFRILWGHDDTVTGSQLSKETIIPLVAKAIKYLQDFSPKCLQETAKTRKQSAAIKTFLDVQDGDDAEGNLYQYTSCGDYHQRRISWMCQMHAHQRLSTESLKALTDYVKDCAGYIDMQQSTLKVDLNSTIQGDRFLTLLTSTRHAFSITIRLTWQASRHYVEKLCRGIAKVWPLLLEIDGVTFNIHPHGRVQYMHNLFADVIFPNSGLKSITLLNYPRPQEQCLYFDGRSLQLASSPVRSAFSCMRVKEVLDAFWESTTVQTATQQFERVGQQLTSALNELGISAAVLTTIKGHGWSATFDLRELVFVDLYSCSMAGDAVDHYSRFARRLTAHLDDPHHDSGLYHAVRIKTLLQELDISYHGSLVRCTEHLVRMWYHFSTSSFLTLIDRGKDTQGRVAARLVRRCDSHFLQDGSTLNADNMDTSRASSLEQRDFLSSIEFLQWDIDHVFNPLSDYYASFLDMATEQHPSVLTLFTLDISVLSRKGLVSIQNVLSRSRLEHFAIVCVPVDSYISDAVSQVLGSVQWPTLKSLKLSGDDIDAWICLWMSHPHRNSFTSNATDGDPRLLQLHLQGSESALQTLSHTSALFVHGLVYSSPWIEVNLDNVILEEDFLDLTD